MNPKDFEGLYAYKLVIPAFTWGSIMCTFLGPLLFPAAWFSFVASFMVLFVSVSLFQLGRMMSMVGRIRRTVHRHAPLPTAADSKAQPGWLKSKDDADAGADELDQLGALEAHQLFDHAFIIPNYKEPLHLLKATLHSLAEHSGAARRYLVVLAMEAGEDGHEQKARKLIEEYTGRFKLITFTSHVKQEGEMAGKASNVDWAARKATVIFRKHGLDLQRVMVTNMDADAQVPELYVAEVDRAAAKAADPHLIVYAAPILFERNAYDVPVFTRVYDWMWSAMAMQNLGSPVALGFPISNYTLSLALVMRVEYWDTNEDAIGEDFHMFVKAYFKTGGQVRLAAIPAPINMLNLQAEGWWATVWARMVQAERHARGCADFAYAVKHARAMPTTTWTTVLLLLKVLEAQMLPATAPFYMGLAAGWAVLLGQYVQHTAWSSFALRFVAVFGIAGLPIFLGLATCNEMCRRYVRPRLYKLPNQPLWRVVDYLALLVDVWLFMVLPTVYALTKSVLCANQGEYVVAEKVTKEEELRLISALSPAKVCHSTHDSSSSLDWAVESYKPGKAGTAGGGLVEVAEAYVVNSVEQPGCVQGIELGASGPQAGERQSQSSSSSSGRGDSYRLPATAQALPHASSTVAVVPSTAEWAMPSAQGVGSVPIRCRTVSRATGSFSNLLEAETPPAREQPPRKAAEKAEVSRFFSNWLGFR